MPAIYLCNVVEIPPPPHLRFVPSLPAGTAMTTLMIDTTRMKAVVACDSTTISGAGISKLIEGPTWGEMRANGRSGGPNNPARNNINNWLTSATPPLVALPAGVTSWYDVIQFIITQVNPGIDMDSVSIRGDDA